MENNDQFIPTSHASPKISKRSCPRSYLGKCHCLRRTETGPCVRMTGHESSSQMSACFENHWFGETASSLIKTGTTHFQDAATLLNRGRLLLQQANKRVAHFSSRAKKADAFFKISTSIRSRRFSCSSWRTCCCSAVSGVPMPRCPLCSALGHL